MELEKKVSASHALNFCFPAEYRAQITAVWVVFLPFLKAKKTINSHHSNSMCLHLVIHSHLIQKLITSIKKCSEAVYLLVVQSTDLRRKPSKSAHAWTGFIIGPAVSIQHLWDSRDGDWLNHYYKLFLLQISFNFDNFSNLAYNGIHTQLY